MIGYIWPITWKEMKIRDTSLKENAFLGREDDSSPQWEA